MITEDRRKAIQSIKNEQNSLGKAIRHMKAARKGGWITHRHQVEIEHLQRTFRQRHVAWSIVKGRKLDQVDSGEGLNMKAVEKHIRGFQERLGVEENVA